MKKLTLVIGLITFSIACNFAQSDVSRAHRLEQQFDSLMYIQLPSLDKNVKVTLYSNFSAAKDFLNLLSDAEKCLTQLKEIKAGFLSLSDNNPNEVDYFLKIAYVELAQLGIYSKSHQFLNAFREDTDYNNYLSRWKKFGMESYSSARNCVQKVEQLDSLNFDMKIISALLLYYDGKVDQSVNQIKKLIDYLEGQKKNVTSDVDYDAYLGMLNSWLGYFLVEQKNFKDAVDKFNNVLAGRSTTATMDWVKSTQDKVQNIQKSCADVQIMPVVYPALRKKGFIDFEYRFDKKNRLTAIVKLEEKRLDVLTDIETLANATYKGWLSLCQLEEYPWTLVYNQLNDQSPKKNSYFLNPSRIMVELTSKNKGFSNDNQIKFLNRFKALYDHMVYFKLMSESWNNLVRENPGINYYRYYRVKNNLAQVYLCLDKEEAFQIFDLYKKLDMSVINEIDGFYTDNQARIQIREDMEYLKQTDPDSFLRTVMEIEVATIMEEGGDNYEKILDLARNIPTIASLRLLNGTLTEKDLDPFALKYVMDGTTGQFVRYMDHSNIYSYLPVFTSAALFKDNKLTELKDEIEKLRYTDTPYANYLAGCYESKIKFLEKEKNITSRFKK